MKLIIILFIFSVSCISCNKCKDYDCPNNAIFEYILVDSKGNNLLSVDNNDYNDKLVEIIGYKGNKGTVHLGGVTSNNIIYFEVMQGIDSVLVKYNSTHQDLFIYENFTFNSIECCESFVDDFKIKLKGLNLCVQCANEIWHIEE